jgi:zinc transport system ATP-binding protein
VSGALIQAQGLGYSDGPRHILYDIDLTVGPGEIVTIVGPNGAGKTTLLRALIGAIRPSKGEVRRKPGLRIGYTPQKLAIDRTMPLTVDRFLQLGGGGGRPARAAALETVGIAGFAQAQVTDLSGGELQRAALARALLRQPDLLALDEPTQGMSASDRVICLNGHVCCEGAPVQVTAMPEYRALFGLGTQGALALYRHEHDHGHHHPHGEGAE